MLGLEFVRQNHSLKDPTQIYQHMQSLKEVSNTLTLNENNLGMVSLRDCPVLCFSSDACYWLLQNRRQ